MTLPIVERIRRYLLLARGKAIVPMLSRDVRETGDTIEELTEQNRRVKLVMGGALTMLAGYDADAANELRAALNEGDA